MFPSPTGMGPLQAYEELMRFAQRRGEDALKLALHAAVPQSFRPDLLHLIKLNFVPEARGNTALEADILFSPLCEDLGSGYFQFYPNVRSLLLDNLRSNYDGEPVPRIERVANFLLLYIEHFDRDTGSSQTRLWRDYLEVQRWVALAFMRPDEAAEQFARALQHAQGSETAAARLQLGGLTSALSASLARHRQLLVYAAGIQALEAGDEQKARSLFSGLEGEEIAVGDVRLGPARRLLRSEEGDEESELEAIRDRVKRVESFDELMSSLNDASHLTRLAVAERIGELKDSRAFDLLVKMALGDNNSRVRQAAIASLAEIGERTAADPLSEALSRDVDTDVRIAAVLALSRLPGIGISEPLVSATRDADAQVREAAVEAIGEIGSSSDFPLLMNNLFDSDAGVRRATARALGKLGNPEAIPKLIDSYRESDSETRNTLITALKVMRAKIALVMTSGTGEGSSLETSVGRALAPYEYHMVSVGVDSLGSARDAELMFQFGLLSRFVIADTRGTNSLPRELVRIMPLLSKVPVLPLVHGTIDTPELARLSERYPSLQEPYRYGLVSELGTAFHEEIRRLESRARGLGNPNFEPSTQAS